MRRAGFAGLLTFLAAFALAGAGAAEERVASAPYSWQNVTVGAGGFAPNIVFSRAEKGLGYIRTDMGGAYRWDARQERWTPLQDGNAVSSYMGVESVAPDPLNPDIVYLAAGMGYWGEAAILRSQDRGDTWETVPVPFKMGGNENGRGLGERLAIDPNRTSTLYFGSRHDGLQRSDDSGRTWRKVGTFPHKGLGAPAGRRETHAGISFVLFDPRSGRPGAGSGIIYAAVADPADPSTGPPTAAGPGRRCPAGPDRRCCRSRATSTGRGTSTSTIPPASAPTTLRADRSGGSTPTPGAGPTSPP
ncbi:MAG TPA: hypothetical protein VF727_10065, partial [Allosphingosinicella sp.]